MNFDHEIKVRRIAVSIMGPDVPLVVGDGWFHVVLKAVGELCDLQFRSRLPLKITGIVVEQGGVVIATNIDEMEAPESVRHLVSTIAAAADDGARTRCQVCGGLWRSLRTRRTWRTRCDVCNSIFPSEGLV